MNNKEVTYLGKGVRRLAGPSLVLGRYSEVSLKVDIRVVCVCIKVVAFSNMNNKEVTDLGTGIRRLAGPSLVLGRYSEVSLKVDICVVYVCIIVVASNNAYYRGW